MKSRINSLFKKKDSLTTSSLENCSRSELIQMTLKFDQKLREYKSQLESAGENNEALKRDADKSGEELQLYKQHSEELQQVLKRLTDEAEDQKALLDSRMHEIIVLRQANNSTNNAEPALAESEELRDLKTQKKSLVTENRELKTQLEELAAEVQGKAQRISLLERNSDSLQLEGAEALAQLQPLEHSNAQLQSEILALEQALKSSHDSAATALNSQTSEFQAKIAEFQRSESAHISAAEAHEEALKSLKDKLATSQAKREAAKKEVMKLNDKLTSLVSAPPPAPLPPQPLHNFKTFTQTGCENKALIVLKHQMGLLYKTLMQLMMNASTLRSQENTILYQIAASEFSAFERELNSFMMNLHEAAENPNFLNETTGWKTKFSNMVNIQPSKLFSCMVRTEPSLPTTILHRPTNSERKGSFREQSFQ